MCAFMVLKGHSWSIFYSQSSYDRCYRITVLASRCAEYSCHCAPLLVSCGVTTWSGLCEMNYMFKLEMVPNSVLACLAPASRSYIYTSTPGSCVFPLLFGVKQPYWSILENNSLLKMNLDSRWWRKEGCVGVCGCVGWVLFIYFPLPPGSWPCDVVCLYTSVTKKMRWWHN